MGSVDIVCNFNLPFGAKQLSALRQIHLLVVTRGQSKLASARCFLGSFASFGISLSLATSRHLVLLLLETQPVIRAGWILVPPPAPCTLAASWRGAGATVALPAALAMVGGNVLAMVVFGGVARAPLVPPTGPASSWPSCHPPSKPLSSRRHLDSTSSRLPGMPLVLGSRHSRH